MSKWINVKDRLPKTHVETDGYDKWRVSNPVLVYCKDGKQHVACCEKIERENGICDEFWQTDLSCYYLEVTHWMPLPKAPEVENDE